MNCLVAELCYTNKLALLCLAIVFEFWWHILFDFFWLHPNALCTKNRIQEITPRQHNPADGRLMDSIPASQVILLHCHGEVVQEKKELIHWE